MRRRRLGIPHGNPAYRNWTRKERRLLGKAPDEEVARQLHRSVQSVRAERNKLGTRAVTDEPPRWTPAEEAVLATLSDRYLPLKLHQPVGAVKIRRPRHGR